MNVEPTTVRDATTLFQAAGSTVRLEAAASVVSRRMPIVAIALGACAAYYVASLVGFQLRLAPATTSVLWPPNATLAAILVLTSPRRWPVILLAVLPVHLFIQMHTDFPLLLILSLYLTNCAEALIAAGLMYSFSDAPSRFDTFRRLLVFFVAAVIVAPFVSSFADAAAVMWLRGESYWRVWETRFFSNTLAELTVLPAVVGGVLTVLRWRKGVSNRRTLEGVLLALGLCTTGWLAFSRPVTGIATLGAISSQTPLALQLPFLLWAAVRFGPTGTGMSVLVASLLNAWAVVHGIGPFAGVPHSTTLPALNTSLIVVASALLCLAALIEERRQAQLAVRTTLEFERVVSRLSAALLEVSGDEMMQALDPWLGRIGRVLGLARVTVFSVGQQATLVSLYGWRARDIPVDSGAADELRCARQALLSQRLAVAPDPAPSTDDGSRPAPGRGYTREAAIPLTAEGQTLGVLGFALRDASRWSPELIENTQLVGEVLASALRRKQSEDALRASEVMKSAILESLTSGVAVLDSVGNLLQMNNRWKQFAVDREWMQTPLGGNLITKCWAVFERGDRFASNVLVAVCAVLDGSRERFSVEHRAESGGSAQWWSLTVVPLSRKEGGAVVTVTDITELRRAEMDAQRTRQELAHVSRVSTVGEMTASLAHQLNQPLTAIMTNAQAAVRMLDSSKRGPELLDEVHEILTDIVNDDRRASEVIKRLRALLRKEDLDFAQVNVTAAIRDVVDLTSSEAIIRNVSVAVEFDAEPIFARGDRVQLQQVVLNLLHNAMDAMNDVYDRPRRIAVECRQPHPDRIVVSVRDSGSGIRTGTEEVVFEPFYTTKPSGMGMGLSIARSIIDAHGGSIRAANHPGGGALFEIHLPAAGDMAG